MVINNKLLAQIRNLDMWEMEKSVSWLLSSLMKLAYRKWFLMGRENIIFGIISEYFQHLARTRNRASSVYLSNQQNGLSSYCVPETSLSARDIVVNKTYFSCKLSRKIAGDYNAICLFIKCLNINDIEECFYANENKPVTRVKMMLQVRAGINRAMKSCCDLKVVDVLHRWRTWPG